MAQKMLRGITNIKGVINALSLDNSEPRKFRICCQEHCREDATGELHRQVRSVSEGALYPHGTLFGCFYITTPAWVSVSARLQQKAILGPGIMDVPRCNTRAFLFVSHDNHTNHVRIWVLTISRFI